MKGSGWRETPGEGGHPVGRLEAFSDGVFSIAITLLVLEIVLPLHSERDLIGALLAQWPSYLAYVVSFFTIGWVWIAHGAITSHIVRVDGIFMRLNLMLLMAVAFLPFPTRLMADYLGQASPERVAVAVYGVVLFVIALLMDGLWRYALRSSELLKDELTEDDLAIVTKKVTLSLGLFGGSILIGVFLPTVGVLCYLAVSTFLVVPFRTIWHAIIRRR